MGSLDSNTDSNLFRSSKPTSTHSIMKVLILAIFAIALVASQDVPDLCESCVHILTVADVAELTACLDKDLADGQIFFKGGQICIEVTDVVAETINLLKSLLAAGTDPREICTLAGICGDY